MKLKRKIILLFFFTYFKLNRRHLQQIDNKMAKLVILKSPKKKRQNVSFSTWIDVQIYNQMNLILIDRNHGPTQIEVNHIKSTLNNWNPSDRK